MEGQLKILGIEGCEPCEKVKSKIGKTIEFIDISKPENVEYTKGLESLKVPIAIDEKGQFCEIFFDDNMIVAQCGDEMITLYEKENEEAENGKIQKDTSSQNG